MVAIPQINPELLHGKYVLLDNDYLAMIFGDEELLSASLQLMGEGTFLAVDSITRIEFLREVWLPEIRGKKEKFLEDAIFSVLTTHDEHFDVIKENALELSRIYAHQKVKSGISFVDLLLAGILMFYSNGVLVTGNKKDFPNCIFDIIGVLNFEQKDGCVRSIAFVELNRGKYAECLRLYKTTEAMKMDERAQIVDDSIIKK